MENEGIHRSLFRSVSDFRGRAGVSGGDSEGAHAASARAALPGGGEPAQRGRGDVSARDADAQEPQGRSGERGQGAGSRLPDALPARRHRSLQRCGSHEDGGSRCRQQDGAGVSAHQSVETAHLRTDGGRFVQVNADQAFA